MQYDRFIGEVQHRARLPSSGQALRAIEATLQTLAERLTYGEVKDLAAQLPQELAFFFLGKRSATGERLSLRDFYRRVSLRENVDLRKSVHHARAVMGVLAEAVSLGEMADVLSQLPEEYDHLFGLEFNPEHERAAGRDQEQPRRRLKLKKTTDRRQALPRPRR